MTTKPFNKFKAGWREWVALPDLDIACIKAKMDTGARTSALHTFSLTPYQADGKQKVKFLVHPYQHNSDIVKECDADVIDQRVVTDSGGHKEERFVILTALKIGGHQWNIEMTLTNRDNMQFRMLIGRSAMKNKIIVDPAKSYLAGTALERTS